MTVERNGETVQVNVNNAQLAADAAAAAALPEAIPVNEVPDRARQFRGVTMKLKLFQRSTRLAATGLALLLAVGTVPAGGPGAGLDHAELQGRRPLADHRGGQRRHRQELHRRPAREGAGDDAVVHADVARTRSTRRSSRSCRCTASSRCPRATRSRSSRTPTPGRCRPTTCPAASARPPTRSSRRWSRSRT